MRKQVCSYSKDCVWYEYYSFQYLNSRLIKFVLHDGNELCMYDIYGQGELLNTSLDQCSEYIYRIVYQVYNYTDKDLIFT